MPAHARVHIILHYTILYYIMLCYIFIILHVHSIYGKENRGTKKEGNIKTGEGNMKTVQKNQEANTVIKANPIRT
jgi:hypothetical protein